MLVTRGATLDPSRLEVADPLVVEVLSSSTRRLDLPAKLAGYVRLPSLAHYLIVDPARPLVVRHARGPGDTLTTRVITDGRVALDPPGIAVALDDFYRTR
ncbi:hypothetical protein A33M_0273 [Rhodovulum sp. PH10]|nr:hypothetical protein A33M_0273 [Rhodovulum sp. PH10]